MAQAETRTLDEIKRDTERARAGLTETVDQLKSTMSDTASDLRERISPEAIKSEVTGYIKSRGEALIDSITDAARQNPLQAVAVGASIAFPALRLLRAIPTPVLMVGAGLYLAGSKRGQALTQQASDAAADAAQNVRRRAHDVSDEVAAAASSARSYASVQMNVARDAAASGAAQVKGQADALGAQLAGKIDRLRGNAAATASTIGTDATAAASDVAGSAMQSGARASSNLSDTLNDAASDLAARVRNSVDASLDAGRDAAAMARRAAMAARDRASDFGQSAMDSGARVGRSASETLSQNPLVVAGVGLVIGGLIASALPRTRIENGLLGDTADGIMNRAKDIAGRGADIAKAVAGNAYDAVARAAEDEGLSTDGMSDAGKDLRQRARKVGEAATKGFDA